MSDPKSGPAGAGHGSSAPAAAATSRPGPNFLRIPSMLTAVTATGVTDMPNLLFVVKIVAQCVVIACPGGLVLVGLYHWHRYRQRSKKDRQRKTESKST